MDWNKVTAELQRKLDPANVKPPSKFGPKGDYIEGWFAIAEANRIFGFGEWSYTIKSLDQNSLKEVATQKGDMQWQAAYTCIVSLTVGGVVREDVGFGSGFAKQIGDAIEGATKEAVTDALKRALRTFGNPFGLALYDKTKANVGVEPSEADMVSRLKAAIESKTDLAALGKLWSHPATNDAIAKMSDDAKADVIAAHGKREAFLMQAPEGC